MIPRLARRASAFRFQDFLRFVRSGRTGVRWAPAAADRLPEVGIRMIRNALEPWHLAIVLVVCLLVFGSKRLPDMARSAGRSLRILKAETRALRDEDGKP
jgi:sec-independent protein translocase protein TatA